VTGPTGVTGNQGVSGAAGPAGPIGPTGLTGPQGLIFNNFTITASAQPPGAISSSLTQNVILVQNPAAEATYTLPSAGPGTAGKDIYLMMNDFHLAGANSILITAASGEAIIIGSAVVCSSPPAGLTCTNPSFPVNNTGAHFVSDGNHHWYCPFNN
jgi:hypothetical protein